MHHAVMSIVQTFWPDRNMVLTLQTIVTLKSLGVAKHCNRHKKTRERMRASEQACVRGGRLLQCYAM